MSVPLPHPSPAPPPLGPYPRVRGPGVDPPPNLTTQVPIRVFVTPALPKGATGKIQRRTMAGHFMPQGVQQAAVAAAPAGVRSKL